MEFPSSSVPQSAASRGETASHSLVSPPRPKRRKIQVACRTCRDSKTRCDGGNPVCSACGKRGLLTPCIYERAQVPSRRHVADLEHRVQRLDRVQTTDQQSFTAISANFKVVMEEIEHGVANASSPSSQNFPLLNSTLSVSDSSQSNIGQRLPVDRHDPYQVDALATVNSIDEDDRLYGLSSTIAFVRHVAEGTFRGDHATLIQDRDNSTSQNAAQFDSRTFCPTPETILERNESASVYPARRRADDFLHCFWEFIHPVFPVIHKTSFIAKYEMLWLPESARQPIEAANDVEEVVFTSNLNLIFALGCQFSTLIPSAQKKLAANNFYQRSRQLFLFDILDSMSVSLVQMLLLTGIYLQSTHHASRCWNSIGLAIRVAQIQGLHLDIAGRRSENQLTYQMRRRIWHTCIILDKLSAMTFGRPTMLSKSWNVPVPSLIDDEYLCVQGEGVQPPDVPPRLGLFVSSCKLFEILHEILSNFYAEDSSMGLPKQPKSKPNVREIIKDVLDYNRRLDKFNDSIPEYLRATRGSHIIVSEKNSCVNLQQQVLYCRFLYIRLLSLRPLLLLATKSKPQNSSQPSMMKTLPSSLDEELIKRCCNMCVTTAHSLVETIHQHLDTAYKSSGWHSVYFTFAAATILLAAVNCQDIEPDVRETSFETCWDQCLSILDHYKEQIHSAPRAIQVLQTLRSQVMATQNQDTLLVAGHHDGQPMGLPFDGGMGTPQEPFDPSLQFDFSQFNPYGTDRISDAWFGQHIVNLDWIDLPPLHE